MDPITTLRTRLDELKAQRDEARTARQALRDAVEARPEGERDLTETEDAEYRTLARSIADLSDEITDVSDRIAEIVDQDLRERRANEALRSTMSGAEAPAVVRSEPQTYREHGEHSHVRDLLAATLRNDASAWERLHRHAQEVDVETRDITRTDGAGGEFVPPLWLVDLYGDFPRAGRVTANLVTSLPLPPGTDSINLPRISTGPQVAVQTADNGAVQETDAVTATVTAPVRTIAGQQDVAIQLVEQSPLAGGIDALMYGQLAADYERALGVQLVNGSGSSGQVTGILGTGSIGSVTYTDASPTVPELYLPLAQAINAVHTNSFVPATHIVMHPRRWNWMTSALDSSNRPLVVPTANGAYMALGVDTTVNAQGAVGTVLGLPVFVDANIPTNLGAGTNEDRIIVGAFPDALLMEGPVRTRVLPDVLSGNLTVRFQLYRYAAFTAGRRPQSFAAISGTGLVQPSGF